MEGNPIGRPRSEIDLEVLEDLCKLQCTQPDIAGWFGIHVHTIENRIKSTEKHEYKGELLTFREIMDRGYANGKVSLRRRQIKAADDGNATMLVWLGKNILGQRDNLEVTGHNTGPIETKDVNPARDIIEARIARERERQHSQDDPGRPD